MWHLSAGCKGPQFITPAAWSFKGMLGPDGRRRQWKRRKRRHAECLIKQGSQKAIILATSIMTISATSSVDPRSSSVTAQVCSQIFSVFRCTFKYLNLNKNKQCVPEDTGPFLPQHKRWQSLFPLPKNDSLWSPKNIPLLPSSS